MIEQLEIISKSKYGILVTIDEVQKVPVEDISTLCNAFQMASRKGNDIMLAVAGLPYSYNEIIRHEGCTYLRRASHEEIGLFTWEEADNAFKKMFSGIAGLIIDDTVLEGMNQTSFGHPYLMQLLGYHLILQVNGNEPGGRIYSINRFKLREILEKDFLSVISYIIKAQVELL